MSIRSGMSMISFVTDIQKQFLTHKLHASHNRFIYRGVLNALHLIAQSISLHHKKRISFL